ncbi:Crp/Fnr family transcriptional regulator [Conexibacter sp. DBS9H8]|uniref:helix-turn-helix domain-containing protein n=1 Tax=Conexibacter sp. DBS9H8 TaxID=2937801 RepID=UPI00200D4D5F|nr:Crp/Fnr family transcriptional regulator [Conexibacter sp. DBS9H8]
MSALSVSPGPASATAEVPAPAEAPTPVVPDSPSTPLVPDPGTPADPAVPSTVPGPAEPAEPIAPPEPGPEIPPEPRQSATVRLLDIDPDLGAGLDAAMFARARELLRAPVFEVGRGARTLPECDSDSAFGLLVLSGLLGRRLRVCQAHATELLGPGDILRPWDPFDSLQSVPPEVDWRSLTPVRVAILDQSVTRIIGRRHELLLAFSGRLLHRVRTGTYLRAVSNLTRVDERVLVSLWHLASRWGNVTPDGVLLPFRLTHEVLGEVVGAQRPSVTLALSRLRRLGIVERLSDGRLVLCGEAPAGPGTRIRGGELRRLDDRAVA